jgi:hypothetical protein
MAGFNLYEIADDGEIARIEAHIYDPERAAFAVESVPKIV